MLVLFADLVTFGSSLACHVAFAPVHRILAGVVLVAVEDVRAVSAVHFVDVAELRHNYRCVAVAWGRFALAQFCHHLKNVSKDTNDTNVLYALHFN
jgi:hypothetical protein